MTDAEERLTNNIAGLRELESNIDHMIADKAIRGLLAAQEDILILETAIEYNLIEVNTTSSPVMEEIQADKVNIENTIQQIITENVGPG